MSEVQILLLCVCLIGIIAFVIKNINEENNNDDDDDPYRYDRC